MESSIVDGRLELTFLARADAGDIEYIPQASVNLVDWEEGAEHVEIESELLSGGDFYRITARPVPDTSESKAFLRVLVREVSE